MIGEVKKSYFHQTEQYLSPHSSKLFDNCNRFLFLAWTHPKIELLCAFSLKVLLLEET
jgi:hypothetical protein